MILCSQKYSKVFISIFYASLWIIKEPKFFLGRFKVSPFFTISFYSKDTSCRNIIYPGRSKHICKISDAVVMRKYGEAIMLIICSGDDGENVVGSAR